MFDSYFNPSVPFTAIDLSDRSVKIARVERRRGTANLIGFARGDLPQGLVVGGRVQESVALSRALNEIFHSPKARKLVVPQAAMTLPEEHCFIRTVRVPRLSRNELEQAVRWEAEAAIPLPPSDAVISWQFLPTSSEADHLDVLVAAAPRDLAESYAEVLERIPMLPVAFEPESFAIARALLDAGDRDPTLIVDLGREHTGVIIAHDRVVRVTANIPIAAQAFTERIAAVRKVSVEEAEEMKRKVGIAGEGEGAELRRILAPVLEDLLRQIREFFGFFETHAHVDPSREEKGGAVTSAQAIRRVLLSGGDAALEGLAPYFQETLGVPVEVGNPFRNLRKKPRKLTPHPLFATAVGLALYEIDTSSL